MGDMTDHFSMKEFSCPCCGKYIPNPTLLYILEAIRWYFNKPLTVNSSTRCAKHNAAVGGEKNSQHMAGTAADIVVDGIQPAVVADHCEKIIGVRGGVGRYGNFTHVDVRGTRARWRG